MSDPLAALLDGRVPAGIYEWPAAPPPDHLSATVAAAGWRPFALDGTRIDSRATFLAACADAFALPHWFGHNWDALWDSLTDLSWAPAPGYVVLYDRWRALASADPEAWATARGLLADVSRHWADRGTPFAVLLTGDGPAWPDA